MAHALGPFALSAQLLPLLRNGNEPRIVWMSSSRGHLGAIDFGDLQKEREYDYGRAYNDAKLGDLLIAFECERRSTASGWGVTSIAAHPGVARTSLIPDGPGHDSSEGWRFRYFSFLFPDAAQGALPLLYAATAPQADGGAYYGPRGFRQAGPGLQDIPENARDPRLGAAYRDTVEQLSGVSFS